MYITLSFPDQRRLEGVVLAIGAGRMRVAVCGKSDTLDFRLVDGYWTAESGERVELDSLIALTSIANSSVSGYEHAMTAGTRSASM